MATIFIRKSQTGKPKYYANLTINDKRIKKYLADNPKSAKLALKKLEYQRFWVIYKKPLVHEGKCVWVFFYAMPIFIPIIN